MADRSNRDFLLEICCAEKTKNRTKNEKKNTKARGGATIRPVLKYRPKFDSKCIVIIRFNSLLSLFCHLAETLELMGNPLKFSLLFTFTHFSSIEEKTTIAFIRFYSYFCLHDVELKHQTPD